MKYINMNSFNYIINIPLNDLNSFNQKTYHLIPAEWKFILMSDGSFTQNLNSLTRKKIITFPAHIKHQYINKKTKIREVYLQDKSDRNLAFARSHWISQISNQTYNLTKNEPIGKSLIKHRADVYKDIHEIYYVYSIYLEKIFNSLEPIWGRKCTIYNDYEAITTIQEFFSPHIISFF
uniref:Uncharacterized protein n=1 Tax=Agarophyton chilense TaxID=2510777 RepID=A0A141SEN5_AGACH|nr:hypothetical protein Gchil_098 [Agarophyton chilense]AMK96753.1 hypothetical protein Gchil_098 [Agarophyton chilense]ASP44648.1 hypothetical protein [Agarophyton chilense]